MQLRSCTGFVTFLALASLSKAAVTLYVVERPQNSEDTPAADVIAEETTIGLSAIGVNEEGATTYVQEVVNSLMVISNPEGPIVTVNSVPETRRHTWIEHASGYSFTVEGSGIYQAHNEVCTFGSDDTGACVREVVRSNPNTVFTVTSTYSGPLSAWHTISDTSSAPAETEAADNSATMAGLGDKSWVAALTLMVCGCVWLGL